jgi:hypothetical protein
MGHKPTVTSKLLAYKGTGLAPYFGLRIELPRHARQFVLGDELRFWKNPQRKFFQESRFSRVV